MRILPRHLRAQRLPGMVIDYVLRQAHYRWQRARAGRWDDHELPYPIRSPITPLPHQDDLVASMPDNRHL
jgi:hypothetical protein